MELPLVNRTCGLCKACCVCYLLSPDEEFWPDGKRAYEPCKFVCEKGCGIHDQPRPHVCTDYECAYIKGFVPHRPSGCGVIFTWTPVYALFQGETPERFPADGCGIQVVETCPEAVLRLSSRRVRYWLRRIPWCVALVQPYGVDVHQRPLCCRCHRDVAVPWKDDPAYADKVIEWWLTN
jgi:hypothetical protein